jgi:dihydroorotate dehydrogenase electron transfer subunit
VRASPPPEIAILVERAGRVSAQLGELVPGQRVPILGPLGKPVALAPGVRHLLLLAHDARIAPLVWLADEEVARGGDVTLLLAAPSAERLYPLDLLDARMEVQIATADGSSGRRGGLLELTPDYLLWADEIVAAAPEPMLRSLTALLRREQWHKPARVLLQQPLACGTGLCGGCPVPLRRGGHRLACWDGPSFDPRELW